MSGSGTFQTWRDARFESVMRTKADMRPQEMFDVISVLFWGVLFAVTTVPSWRILRRAGLSPWWSLLSFVPMIGTILILWIIAYRKWPNRN
jgi:uncharacterized membrane protein YhaH (DUF805 family)